MRAPRDLDLPFEAATGMPRTATTRREPPPPITVSSLVEEGTQWRLTTAHGVVRIWIPKRYDVLRAETILYVHGYYVHVDDAWTEHDLPRQFAASGINAMFIVCEAPASDFEQVSWSSTEALLAAVAEGIGQPTPKRRVIAVGHSGAHRTMLEWLGGKELDTIVLLDAAYGEVDRYRDWVLASPKRRLIYVGEETRWWTDRLHADLPRSLVLDRFPTLAEGMPQLASRARFIYIKSSIGHHELVTGGTALPMILQTLRARPVIRTPLVTLLAREDVRQGGQGPPGKP
jgi:hypothetical protein